MFPVRYELNFYINLLRNSVFKGLNKIRFERTKEVLDLIDRSVTQRTTEQKSGVAKSAFENINTNRKTFFMS
jgi:hypothetical protein